MLEYIIAGGVILVGIILFFYFSNKTSYKQPTISQTSGIDHYKEQRDQATLEDAADEEEVVEEETDEETNEDEETSYVSSDETGFPRFTTVVTVVVGIAFVIFMWNVLGGVKTSLGAMNASTANSGDYKNIVIDGMGGAGEAMVQWLDLIVLLIVLGFIVGVFVKLGSVFDTSSYDEPVPKKKKTTKPVAIQHYEGMRDELSHASLKKDKKKLARLQKEGRE